MTRPEPKYKKVDMWVYGEVKEIELISFDVPNNSWDLKEFSAASKKLNS